MIHHDCVGSWQSVAMDATTTEVPPVKDLIRRLLAPSPVAAKDIDRALAMILQDQEMTEFTILVLVLAVRANLREDDTSLPMSALIDLLLDSLVPEPLPGRTSSSGTS